MTLLQVSLRQIQLQDNDTNDDAAPQMTPNAPCHASGKCHYQERIFKCLHGSAGVSSEGG